MAKPRLIAANMLNGGSLNAPKFKIILSKSAAKYLKRLDGKTRMRFDRCFLNLEQNPLAGGDIKPIAGKDSCFRYRVGDWRVVYFLNFARKRIEVAAILPRGQIYKKRGA